MSEGIYSIQCKINGKRYIGQSWDIENRWRGHKCESKKTNTFTKIYNAIRKYKYENFDFIVIEEYPDYDLHLPLSNQEIMDMMENYYIGLYDSIKNGYNTKQGGSTGKHSEESKEKFRGDNNPFYGKKHTAEELQKMSEAHNGRVYKTGHKLSEEHKKKLSEAKKGKPGNKKGKRLSDDSKRKISEGLSGKQLSEDHKKNISLGLLGENNTWRGKHHSDETKKKLSEAHSGENSYWYGRTHTEETKEKLRRNYKPRLSIPGYRTLNAEERLMIRKLQQKLGLKSAKELTIEQKMECLGITIENLINYKGE